MTETASKSPAEKLPEFSERFSGGITLATDFRGDLEFEVKKELIRDMIRFLKDELKFDFLIDLFGMDYSKFHPNPRGLAVIYILYSGERRRRVRLKVILDENFPQIHSICEVFVCANWFEREAWDMFGIQFENHPNLKRILCHNDFVGHPLKKSYPSDKYQRLKGAIESAEM